MENLTSTSILKLNAYCLFAIFEQIRNNCKLSENIDRYRDLINFGLSNDYIHSVYLDWIDDDLWARLEVKRACLLSSVRVFLDLAEVYESLKPYTTSEKQKFWDIFSTSLAENSDLRECFIAYVSNSYYPEHMDIFERITKLLQTKRSLRRLHLQMQTYSAENLETFRNLRSLQLTLPMDADALVRCVRSNPNLTDLMFRSTEIYGRLADIAPYGKNIQYLNIKMKPESNSLEYAPLTKLPNLSILRLGGDPEPDSLGALFKSMADNGSRALRMLQVEQPIESGIQELSRLHHLELLECELKIPPPDLSPRHSWQWPNICAVDLEMDSTEDENLDHISMDILTSKGVLGLVSKNRRLINQMILRLNKWYQNRCQSSSADSPPMWLEIVEMLRSLENLRCKDISDPQDMAKITTFALLKALENQWPIHAHNIQLLARISDLKELRLKIKLNIERELMRLQESDIRFNMEDFETEIPIGSDTQEIINLALLAYLRETLVRSKFANIKSNIAIRNLEMEINFDIRP